MRALCLRLDAVHRPEPRLRSIHKWGAGGAVEEFRGWFTHLKFQGVNRSVPLCAFDRGDIIGQPAAAMSRERGELPRADPAGVDAPIQAFESEPRDPVAGAAVRIAPAMLMPGAGVNPGKLGLAMGESGGVWTNAALIRVLPQELIVSVSGLRTAARRGVSR